MVFIFLVHSLFFFICLVSIFHMSPFSNCQLTPMSSMDRWICSRLYSTVVQCEQAFEAYELHIVTSDLYSFWVHSLCDVYMVRSITFPHHHGYTWVQTGKIINETMTCFLCVSSDPLTAQSTKERGVYTWFIQSQGIKDWCKQMYLFELSWQQLLHCGDVTCVCHFPSLSVCVSCRSMWSLCWSNRMRGQGSRLTQSTVEVQGRWPAVSSITVCPCLWLCSPPSCPLSPRSCGKDSNHSDLELLLPIAACAYRCIPAPLSW